MHVQDASISYSNVDRGNADHGLPPRYRKRGCGCCRVIGWNGELDDGDGDLLLDKLWDDALVHRISNYHHGLLLFRERNKRNSANQYTTTYVLWTAYDRREEISGDDQTKILRRPCSRCTLGLEQATHGA